MPETYLTEAEVCALPDGNMSEGQAASFRGRLLTFLESQDRPNQLMRIMERLGGYDKTRLDMTAPVYNDADVMIEAYYDEVHHE